MICSFVEPIGIRLSYLCTTNIHMRLFFSTSSLIGSISDRIFHLTYQQAILIQLISDSIRNLQSLCGGLKFCVPDGVYGMLLEWPLGHRHLICVTIININEIDLNFMTM